jgi:L-lactate dehydrogenase (cytochrome)
MGRRDERTRRRPAERRVPRWRDLRPLIRLAPPAIALERRLERAATIADLRRMAARRAPRAVFDYVDGGAGDELSMARAVRAFDRVEFHPRTLRDVTAVSPATTILGEGASMPLVLAPTGLTRMMHHSGEPAVARAAARARLPYVLSTMGTTSPEEVIAVDPSGTRWFQLYVWRDRRRIEMLIERVAEAGFRTLMLTVDVPVPGDRRRDVRNGLAMPPALRWRSFVDGALHPRWWFDLLTTEPLRFAAHAEVGEALQDVIERTFDPAVTMNDLSWLRDRWTGTFVVKGVMRVDDAREMVSHGVDGLVISNHGGRQLDRSVTPLEVLPEIVDAVGDRVEMLVDGGVRSGADVVAAVGLGAKAAMIGRAYLYGLMAGGERGVDRALSILRDDVVRTMQLLGIRSLGELDDSTVALRD